MRHVICGALLVLALLPAESALARRRAVRSAPPPRFVAPRAATVTVTNHAPTAVIVQLCSNTCSSDALGAGMTRTYDLAGLGNGTLTTLYSETDQLEARTDSIDMLPTSTFTTAPLALPVVDLTRYAQELLVFSTKPGTIDVALLGFNGVQEDVRTYPVAQGLTRIPNPYGVAATNKQLHLRASVPIAALLLATHDTATALLVAQRPDTARAEQYLVRFHNASTWVKNPRNDGVMTANTYQWPSNQDNTTTLLQGRFDIINGGIEQRTLTAPAPLTFGIVGAYHPLLQRPISFLAWAIENDHAVPFIPASAGAIARSGVPGDETQRYQLSINQPGELTLMNTTSDQGSVSGKLLGYDANGVPVSTQDYTLRTKENRTFTLTTPRTTVTFTDAVDSAMTPQVVGTLQHNGITYAPYQLLYSPPVTGLEYVSKWFNPVEETVFYLDNTEVRCMIRGACGTLSYARSLATLLARSPDAAGASATQLEQELRNWTDGDLANRELTATTDPLTTAVAGERITFTLGNSTQSYRLTGQDLLAWHAFTVREFLFRYVAANPTKYDGTTTAGPNLAYNPTWSTQDPN